MSSIRSKMAVAVLSVGAVAGGFYGGSALLDRVQFARAAAEVDATRQQLSTVNDLSTVFRQVGKVVEPSVVNIQVRKTIKAPAGGGGEDQLRRFFHENLPNMPQMPQGNGDGGDNNDNAPNNNGGGDNDNSGGMEEVGTGSGVIMEAKDGYGYILTNNHVAGGATEMDITLSDGRQFHNGKLLGADPKSDLAVVQIKADRLIAAKWGNSEDLSKGDWVLAFGSPFGYVGSMTHGIISALNRTDVGIIQSGGYEDFIQVDAPINPGNSGGPLTNIHGEVIGINTAIATRSGGFQGIGFAIPSNQAKGVYAQLKDHGKVVRGWLGVSIRDVAKDPDVAHSFGYSGDSGVLVEQTFPNTPATDKLQAGDVVTAYNSEQVENVTQLRNDVAQTSPGTEVTLKVFREGKPTDVKLTIGNQPADLASVLPGGRGRGGSGDNGTPGNTANAQALGLRLNDLTDALGQQLGVPDLKGGAVVTNVARNSPAAKAGLRPGDVITRVGGTAVASADEAADAMNKLDPRKGIRLYVTSREGSRFAFLKVAGSNGDSGDENSK